MHDGAAFSVRVETCRAADLPGPLAAFHGSVAEVRRDEVGYARLTSGIVFELPDAATVVARWRETIEALRSVMSSVVGISGASGVIYGVRMLEVLRLVPDVETHLVMTPAARETVSLETDLDPREVDELADVVLPLRRHRGRAFERLLPARRDGRRPVLDEDALGDRLLAVGQLTRARRGRRTERAASARRCAA